ncbi:hypothetical protein D3C72_1824930 [compost metagenome]
MVVLIDYHGHGVVAAGEREANGEAILGDSASGAVDDFGFEDHYVIDELVQALYQGKVAQLRALALESLRQHQRLAA